MHLWGGMEMGKSGRAIEECWTDFASRKDWILSDLVIVNSSADKATVCPGLSGKK